MGNWAGEKESKQRWTVKAKDGQPLTFAGLWGRCETTDEGVVVESFTIITQSVGSPLKGYQDRAPMMIWKEDRQSVTISRLSVIRRWPSFSGMAQVIVVQPDETGQVMIPPDVLRALAVGPGDTLRYNIQDDGTVLVERA